MESDVRKLLVNKIAKNIYEALLNKRSNNDPWQQMATSGNNSWSQGSDDGLMASILESVHGTLGSDEGNGFEDRRRSERYVPIPLTVEELNSNREPRSGPTYQVPSPKCNKYEVPIQKYQEPSQNYQEPSQKYRETIYKYHERSPRYKESSYQYQDPKPSTKYQVPSPKTSKSSKKNGVHWAKMPEESAFVDEDCSREFDELYYSSVVTSHKKTDREAEASRPREHSVRFGG